jgi:hypothetical protein
MLLAHLMLPLEEMPPQVDSCPAPASSAPLSNLSHQHTEDIPNRTLLRPPLTAAPNLSTASRSRQLLVLEATKRPSRTTHRLEPRPRLGAFLGLPLDSRRCSWVPVPDPVCSSHSSFLLKLGRGP